MYFLLYFIAKFVESTIVYTYSPTRDLFWQQLPKVWQSYFLAILLYIFIMIANNEVSKFYDFERQSPFLSLFGSLSTDLEIMDEDKVAEIKREAHGKFKEHLDEDFTRPLQNFLIFVALILVFAVLLYAILSGENASGYLPEGTHVSVYENPLYLLPAATFVNFAIFVPTAYIIFGGLTVLYRLVVALRGLSKNEELSKYLTITQLSSIIDITSGGETVNIDNADDKEIKLSPSIFEYYAGFSLQNFKRNAAPITQLALKITIIIFVGLTILNLYAIFITFPLLESEEVRTNLILFYLGLNVVVFAAMIGLFIYPQLAIHEMILKGKTALINRLEGINQLILARILINSQKGNFDASAGSVALLNELNAAIERLNNMLSWPFDYKQMLTFAGTAIASGATFVIGFITQA